MAPIATAGLQDLERGWATDETGAMDVRKSRAVMAAAAGRPASPPQVPNWRISVREPANRMPPARRRCRSPGALDRRIGPEVGDVLRGPFTRGRPGSAPRNGDGCRLRRRSRTQSLPFRVRRGPGAIGDRVVATRRRRRVLAARHDPEHGGRRGTRRLRRRRRSAVPDLRLRGDGHGVRSLGSADGC